ncbi:MAG: ATPase central domain protein [Verrucomicrobiales bacterium]|nr:ATPase central domain protein [Verrucomicrobiales bacterium]
MASSDALKAALTHSPDNIPLLLLYAEACLGEWETGEALASYEHVLRLESSHAAAALGLARTLFMSGRASEAAVRLELLIQRNDSNAPAHLLLARVLLSENDRSAARGHYRKAVELDGTLADPALDKDLGAGATRIPVTGDGGAFPFTPEGGEPDNPFSDPEETDAAAVAERPRQTFADIGGMEALKEEIRMKIIHPLKNPELFRAYGKKVGGGVLLYGPPGCGKTLLSRATAGEIKATFFCIGLHDVLDMWLGSSEKQLHQLFENARRHAPSVLFFDEIDALAADRRDLRGSAGRTLINQFLAELDGGDDANEGVLILGATNAPWHLDPAFRRPGRFDRTLFVPPPDEPARASIIEIIARDKPVAELDARALAKKTDRFSGADLKAVFDSATEEALTMAMKEGRVVPIQNRMLQAAAKRLQPTTGPWFESARNHALYANQSGQYDEILAYLGLKRK